MKVMRHLVRLLILCLFAVQGLHAAGPAFDLAGPKVDVHVKRGEVTLPIGEVPNLQPGDRLWVHPDFPASQSEHYVLIVAFLRGSTNPPPPEWFTRVETWKRKAHDEGVFVTVPQEAQQAVIFLAPETGGDFSTLRSAVRGRPGSFVRATQDLQAASWDRMRVNTFLSEVKVTSQTDPASLKERAEKAARSLSIKLNQQCFDRPLEQQAPCLSQNTEGLALDDTSTESRVAQIANGSTIDLMNQLSYSSMGGAGAYSPYVGAIVDTAKILSSLHTAHYQYIPALALPTQDTLNLRLNVPPSFRDPKSVVVVALPPVEAAKMPPLHPVDPSEHYCAQKPGLVLQAEGAPLVFGSHLAHDLILRIDTKDGVKDLAVEADPSQGGLVFTSPVTGLPAGDLTGELRGKWGFDDWDGPHFHFHSAGPGQWTVSANDQSALVVGRDDTLHLDGDSTLCVEKVDQQVATGSPLTLKWKAPKPTTLEVTVPLKNAAPGPVKLEIHEYGVSDPDTLTLTSYAEAASLDRLALSAGDTEAVLTGTRLDEVAKASLNGITWSPAKLRRVEDADRLTMNADSPTSGLEPGRRYFARVNLRDGRDLRVRVDVSPQRPQVTLLNKGTQDVATDDPLPVRLGSADDLPVKQRLVFFLKSTVPGSFPRNEKVEVAAVDGSFHTTLSLNDGSLMLADAKTALGKVEPLKSFGASAFGPVEVRAISADGVTGDWIPLGTLVRLPGFGELHCPRSQAKPCVLDGSDLFLMTSIAATPEFDNPTDVPPDFTGTELTVPHPTNGLLYLKLRDDPTVVQTLALPVLPVIPSPLATPPVPAPVTSPSSSSAPKDAPEAKPNAASPATDAPASSATAAPSDKAPATTAPGASTPAATAPANAAPTTATPTAPAKGTASGPPQ
jgi:hypothetical protein